MNHTDNHFFLNLYQSNFSNNSKSTTMEMNEKQKKEPGKWIFY